MATIEVSGDVAALTSLPRQINYAAAVSLTRTAKEGQSASLRAIRATFTTRNDWYLPSNRFGVKVKPATKDNLESEVSTLAYWLALHETGGIKKPRGKYLAIPTAAARRSNNQAVSRSRRPRNLRRTFVADTRTGPVLFERQSRGRAQALYNLEPRARIRKQSVVIEPVLKVVSRRFEINFDHALDEALETVTYEGRR
jgi:hypothetical protein